MAFWLREHRIIRASRLLSPRVKVMIIGTMWALCLAVCLGWLFLPLHKKLQHEQSARRDLLQQTTAFQKVSNKLGALQLECKNLETESSLRDVKTASFHETIDFLVHSLRKHGILCKQLQPMHRKKYTVFDKEYCTMTLVGTFGQIITFLDEVKQSGRLIKFKTLDLKRWKDDAVKVTAFVRIATEQQGVSS